MNQIEQTCRVLSNSESVSLPASNTIRLAVHCTGSLNSEHLKRAWMFVGREAPGLAGTISVREGRYVFHHDPEKAGLVTCKQRHEDDLKGYLTLDELDAVAAIEICRIADDRHIVSLLVRHAIADGRYCLHAATRMWELYCELSDGIEPRLHPPILARPLEAILEERGFPQHSRRKPSISPLPVYYCAPMWEGRHLSKLCHSHVLLDRDMTHALSIRCKESSITMHGAIAASLVLSQRQSRTDLQSFSVSSIVDLRSRIEPQMHPIEGTYVLGYSTTEVDMRLYSDIVSIAKLIADNMKMDIQSGAAHESGIANADLQSNGAAPTLLSNLGVVPTFAHPEGLRFTDFTIWNEMNLATPGSSDLLTAYGNMLVAYTFDDRLRIDLFYGKEMFPNRWSETQASQMEHILTEFADNE